MPHETRAEVQMRDLDLEVNVRWRPQESAVDVDYRSQGLEGVLYKLELAMSAGGQLETDQLRLPCDAGQSAVLRSGGEAMYRLGSDVVRMTGGSDEHNSTRAMRGSEPPDASAFALYCTGVTPVEGTLRIERVGPSSRLTGVEGEREHESLPTSTGDLPRHGADFLRRQ